MSQLQKLARCMVPPAGVAKKLDWRKLDGTVLSLEIGKHSIGMALAQHPESSCETPVVKALGKIDINRVAHQDNRLTLHPNDVETLREIIKKHSVCGLVVGWPAPSGRLDYNCGLVMHTLQSFQDNDVLNQNRPYALWTPSSLSKDGCDKYGRSAIYAQTAKPQIRSNRERTCTMDAGTILKEFMMEHFEHPNEHNLAASASF